MAEENQENTAPESDDTATQAVADEVLDASEAGDGAGEMTVESSGNTGDIFPDLTDTGAAPNEQGGDLGLIVDIPVQLTVELGRTRIPIKHILQLAQGSVIELDAQAGEPMDVLVNGCLIAQGEVVVVNEKFGVRLTDIVMPSERVKRLHRTG